AARLATTLEQRGRTPAQTRLRRRFLRFVPVRKGARVLEVGCGTGVVLRDVAGLVGRRGTVVGVDPSLTILKVARTLCRLAEGGRITLRRADGARLPFRAGGFDVALAVTVILHVSDPLRVVQEMARVGGPALARRLHGARGARGVRADDELLRRGRGQGVRVGAAGVALLVAATVAPAAEPSKAAAPFDGAAALRHVERLVALGPRPAGSLAAAKARAYILG